MKSVLLDFAVPKSDRKEKIHAHYDAKLGYSVITSRGKDIALINKEKAIMSLATNTRESREGYDEVFDNI